MKSKHITAIIGYGPQGRAWAMNLRDSGREIIIALPPRAKERRIARKDGFAKIITVAAAAKIADRIIFAFPDHLHHKVYENEIIPYLMPRAALIFLHGLSVHFGQVKPPKNSDIILLAPLGPGNAVRESYRSGESIGYFYALHQNGSGQASRVLNDLIRDLKIPRRALIKTTFAEEAVGDLFGEQAVLCGGLSQLIKAGFETLTESGLAPEKAYLEVAYQLDLIIDLVKNHGLAGMLERISVAARYGTLISGPEIIDVRVKKKMQQVLKRIKSGKFARDLSQLDEKRLTTVNKCLPALSHPLFEKAAKKFAPK